MYADADLFLPYQQSIPLENQQHDGYGGSYESDSPMSNLVQTVSFSDYDYGADGDLFKPSQTIFEEQINPNAEMFRYTEDGILTSSFPNYIASQTQQQLLAEAFSACEKGFMGKGVMESPISQDLDVKVPITDETLNRKNNTSTQIAFHKSESSGSLTSMDWGHGAAMQPNFLDLNALDLEIDYKMRRAFSEGDIKTLNCISANTGCSSALEWVIGNCASEDRREKLSRYRNKKNKRNFGRKIKYACRKALADNQPRIRGRFAKTE